MEGVFFKPWVGNKYFEYGVDGVKILVLGEAHWCSNDSDNFCEGCDSHTTCSLTNEASERFINYKKGKSECERWMPTWTRFINVFFGEQVSNDSAINFWESIVFYDYVQRPMPTPRICPSEKDFADGEIGFETVCKKYNPDLIIVWGKRLWRHMPDNGYWDEKYILDEQGGKIYYYQGEGKDIPAYHIYHPSTSYFGYKYTKYLLNVMSLVKRNIKRNNKVRPYCT